MWVCQRKEEFGREEQKEQRVQRLRDQGNHETSQKWFRMSAVGSGSKRRREVVGDFFIDFYPESRDLEALRSLSSENPIRLPPGEQKMDLRMGRWQVCSVSLVSWTSRYRSQLGFPTCLMVEAMGIDDNYLWKHMQIGNSQILVCLRIACSAC